MNFIFLKKKLFNQLVFDAEFYRKNHPDLVDTNLSTKELYRHFMKIGIPEGRSGSPVFDVKYYIEQNDDVRELVKNDFKKAIKHFLFHGVHDCRPTSPRFNVNVYLNSNEDLKAAIGEDYLSLYQHFVTSGKAENRPHNGNAVPDSFMIELTNACNLRCITCPREYQFGKEMDVGNMVYAKLNSLLAEILPLAKSINLTGLGETFLYKDLVKVVDTIINYSDDITIFLSTNAHTPNCLTMFDKIKSKVSLVQISTDGVGTVYERVRDGACFDTFSTNVKKMAKAAEGTSTSLMLNMVAFHENHHSIPDVVSFAKEAGVGHVHVNSRNLVTMPGLDIREYDFYIGEEFQNSLNKGKELAKDLGIGFSTYGNSRYCELVYNHFYITWDGYLVPCCAKPFPKEFSFGNVFDQSLLSCIKNYQTSDFRNNWDHKITPNFCSRCHIVH